MEFWTLDCQQRRYGHSRPADSMRGGKPAGVQLDHPWMPAFAGMTFCAGQMPAPLTPCGGGLCAGMTVCEVDLPTASVLSLKLTQHRQIFEVKPMSEQPLFPSHLFTLRVWHVDSS